MIARQSDKDKEERDTEMSTESSNEPTSRAWRISKETAAVIAGIGTLLSGIAAIGLHFRDPPQTHETASAQPEQHPLGGISKPQDDRKARPHTPLSLPRRETTPPSSETKPPARAYNEKYINTDAVRAKDKPNISVFVRLPEPSPLNALQNAVQRSLRQRGDNVVSIFREPFAKEDLDIQLFQGNPTLAKRLELRKYCDMVLLGLVTFRGPPQDQNHSGLYMREAILNLHAISADTGEVLDDIEITAKGRGLDADASTGDALQALEGNIEEKVREWARI
jgi:hypothetical protein